MAIFGVGTHGLMSYKQVTIITVKVAAVIANKNSFIIPIIVTPTFLDPIRCKL